MAEIALGAGGQMNAAGDCQSLLGNTHINEHEKSLYVIIPSQITCNITNEAFR